MDAGLRSASGSARQTFGPFTLDHDRAELTRDGATVVLRPKTFALLTHLARHPGNVVAKQELLDAVWPGVVVTDDSLTQAISELRSALGDRDQQMIRTVAKRGYRFDATVHAASAQGGMPHDASGPAAAPADTGARRWAIRGTALVFGTLVVAVLGLGLTQFRGGPQRIDAELAQRRSIAVVPFTDLSEPKAPHLVYAVDNDLITDIARFGDIRVIARESATAAASGGGVDAKEVGRKLDVRHVVTGSVKRDGQRVAITVRLTRTATGAVVWAERFDYASASEWSDRRDIPARLANLLDAKIQQSAAQQSLRSPLNDAAVDHWMRGHYLLGRFTRHAELLQVRAHFEAALAAQPESGHALAGVAATYVCEALYRWTKDPKAALETGKALARRALEIDPYDQTALKMLTGAHLFLGEIDEALSTTRKQLELNPNDAHSNRDLAAGLFRAGRWEETLRQLDVAQSLNPLDHSHVWKCHSIRARTLVVLRRYAEAIEQARLSAAADASVVEPYLHLAASEAQRGNLDAARQHVAEILRRRPDHSMAKARSIDGSNYPQYHAGMAHYYEGLRLAGLPEGPTTPVAAK